GGDGARYGRRVHPHAGDDLPEATRRAVGWTGTERLGTDDQEPRDDVDRKSTRLNSSHSQISYAVFCLKKKSGQSCIAVQRVYAERGVHDRLLERLVDAVTALRTGDPRDEATDVGPLIDSAAAERVEQW